MDDRTLHVNHLRRVLDHYIDSMLLREPPPTEEEMVAVDQACSLGQTLAGGRDEDTAELDHLCPDPPKGEE